MGFVAFIPLGYWTAWLIPAVLARVGGTDDLLPSSAERSGSRGRGEGYIGLAAFYSLPILLSGGNPVSVSSFLALCLCAAHVQIARLKDDMDVGSAIEERRTLAPWLGDTVAALSRRAADAASSAASREESSEAAASDVNELLKEADDDTARRAQEELERFDSELRDDDG